MDKKIEILDGKKVADKITEEIKAELSALTVKPRLDIFLIGDNQSSIKYVELKKNKAQEVGINVEIHKYEADVSEDFLISEITDLNNDSLVNGIMVQLPLPTSYYTNKILNTISAIKDVDGLTAINLGKCFAGLEDGILSATARAIKELLENYQIDVKGKDVVILGTSVEVGLPTAAFLFNLGATVQMCNLSTKDIKEKTNKADIIISATGTPGLITKDFVKQDAVVIDVGFTILNGKVYGDVEVDSVSEIASALSPVPGGIGPLTVVSLLKNTFLAFKNQTNAKRN